MPPLAPIALGGIAQAVRVGRTNPAVLLRAFS
jgi:hypothetical protein